MKFISLLLAALSLALSCLPLPADSASPALHRTVLVFVPAYEASQLFDPDLGSATAADPTCVWGNLNVFFSQTEYFALRMPNPLVPRTMLRVGPVDIYGAFVKALTTSQDHPAGFSPYTEGADFFIFNYDWRQDIGTVSAPQFARAMESYARVHAQKTGIPEAETEFIIVTHSMGGLVARTWLSENPGWAARIRGLYLVGAPNLGCVKAARTVIVGPDSLKSRAHGFPGVLLNLLPTSVDQNVTKLTGITRPSLYELLPFEDPSWVRRLAVGATAVGANQILDPETWESYWPSAALEKRVYLDRWLKQSEEEGRKTIHPADWEFCQDAGYAKLKELLEQTGAWRARQGSLQHTASLLTEPGQATRLRLIYSTGLKTPSGLVSWGEHDSSEASYTYHRGNDGDGTMEARDVLAGFPASAANVKSLNRVPHGRLMIDPVFLSYFLRELSGQELASPAR